MSLTILAELLSQQAAYFPCTTQFEFQIVDSLPFPEIQNSDYLVPVKGNNLVGEGYWLFWREELGVWFNSNGSKAKIFITRGYDSIAISLRFSLELCSVVSGIDLSFQNRIAIHGNAISIDGKGVAFIGCSGRGKSTISYYCASEGAKFVSDDVLLVDNEGLIHPGCPQVRAYTETIEKLSSKDSLDREYNPQNRSISVLKRRISRLPKKIARRAPIPGKKKLKSFLTHKGIIKNKNNDYSRYKNLYNVNDSGFKVIQTPVPLNIVYVLERSSDSSIYSEELHSARGAFRLINHSYYAYDLVHSHPKLLAKYLELSKHISVRKLYYQRDFAALTQVYDFIREEIRRLNLNKVI